MMKVYPDYYNKFRCIASKCRHNCCIGWAIEIDEDTDSYYRQVAKTDNPLSSKLISCIDRQGENAEFIIDEQKRCPFLNSHNLCDIYTELGETNLCTICTEHPRFHNELPSRVESGLGMCCEEAARLILTNPKPVELIYEGLCECEDEIIDLRDEIIKLLQNREKPVSDRISDMLALCGTAFPHKDLIRFIDLYLSLERLDKEWTDILVNLKDYCLQNDSTSLSFSDTEHEVMYEQLCVYLVYRHLANAYDLDEASLYAKFTALSYYIIRSICNTKKATDTLTPEILIDICRMYSAEIEYSDENIDILLDALES